jgi:hypothetical protein
LHWFANLLAQSLLQETIKGGDSPKELKRNQGLAEEAVIGELVSGSHFPVSRENTGKFWRSRPLMAT